MSSSAPPPTGPDPATERPSGLGWRRWRALGEVDGSPDHRPDPSPPRFSGPAERRPDTDHDPAVIAFFRRVRRALPGDPHFGDRLSATGSGGPEAAARAAERMLGDDDAASRELSLDHPAGVAGDKGPQERAARP